MRPLRAHHPAYHGRGFGIGRLGLRRSGRRLFLISTFRFGHHDVKAGCAPQPSAFGNCDNSYNRARFSAALRRERPIAGVQI